MIFPNERPRDWLIGPLRVPRPAPNPRLLRAVYLCAGFLVGVAVVATLAIITGV